MKIYHIADLHFGKTIYGIPLIRSGDQPDWARKFLDLCARERPDAVVIAGDVYDRSAPSGDAVELLDFFLTSLAEMNLPVLCVAGNHDSGQRLAFGRTLLAKQNIHIAGKVGRKIEHIVLEDEYGPVTFWLQPYMFPEQVSVLLEDETIRSYDQAMRALLAEQEIDLTQRNVIIAHQNITADGREAERGGSESMVGGVGQIDYTAFAAFDYAALGHIHSSYPVGRQEVRYAGTPLCYHLEETRQPVKGPVCVELKEKGTPPQISVKEISPLHRMRYLKGTKDEIYSLLRNDEGRNEYIGIVLKDVRVTPEISAYLRQLTEERGSVLVSLTADYAEFSGTGASASAEAVRQKTEEELFADLYAEQNGGTPPDEAEYEVMQYIGELVRNQDCRQPMNPNDTDKIISRAEKAGGGR